MTKVQAEEVPGFPSLDFTNDDDGTDNKKKKKKGKAKKSGGFQSMGLNFEVIKGITKRGYQVPTPIQRKTIPLIMEGRDVVAMAKTGSGKTACFLIPMFEKLKCRDPTKGARALILSPTRELAVQTYKFIKDLGRFMDLRTILVLGGDSMDSQFSAIHTCPDIIVATPGRFLHLCVEMDLKLNSVEYVVFDEADRLFEMGFEKQLHETLHRLPSSRQMVMFSATLPKLLVDFARAGLSDPVLIRLDVDTKLPETLALKFLYCRSDDRYTSLIVLLKYIVPSDAQTIVFAGTHHHVELTSNILTNAGITNTMIYSSLDPTARKINTAKFVTKKVSVLIVTDVAARGIDIPNLDYVINLHFPGKPKLFLHRVGRCARAGRTGTAYTIFATEDAAHLMELHFFLNRPFNWDDSKSFGTIPQDILEEEHLAVQDFLQSPHLSGNLRTSVNAYKKYITSRPLAAPDANARAKKLKYFALKPLEDFLDSAAVLEHSALASASTDHSGKKNREQLAVDERALQMQKHDILVQMRNFRPHGTIFELNSNQKSVPFKVMREKRKKHNDLIEKYRAKVEELDVEEEAVKKVNKATKTKGENVDDETISSAFNKIIAPKKRRYAPLQQNGDGGGGGVGGVDAPSTAEKRPKLGNQKDVENYIPYQSSDKHTEDGLAINSFQQQASKAEFSVIDRSHDGNDDKIKPGQKKWDRIKHKYVAVENPREGKIRTESGAWIPASFKTGRYDEWKEKSKIEEQLQREAESGDENSTAPAFKQLTHAQRYPVSRHARHNAKVEAKKRSGAGELRHPDQIVKDRMRLEFIKKRNADNKIRKAENRKRSMRKYQRAKVAKGKSGGRRK